jgi:hypothetical protein
MKHFLTTGYEEHGDAQHKHSTQRRHSNLLNVRYQIVARHALNNAVNQARLSFVVNNSLPNQRCSLRNANLYPLLGLILIIGTATLFYGLLLLLIFSD